MHRSPGFITSNLIGKKDDGTLIKEFEASHGTVADLWAAHRRGEETSMNPLGMVRTVNTGQIVVSCLAGANQQLNTTTASILSICTCAWSYFNSSMLMSGGGTAGCDGAFCRPVHGTHQCLAQGEAGVVAALQTDQDLHQDSALCDAQHLQIR